MPRYHAAGVKAFLAARSTNIPSSSSESGNDFVKTQDKRRSQKVWTEETPAIRLCEQDIDDGDGFRTRFLGSNNDCPFVLVTTQCPLNDDCQTHRKTSNLRITDSRKANAPPPIERGIFNLCLTVDLAQASYPNCTKRYHGPSDVKIEVFVNGELADCRYINNRAKRSTAGAHELAQDFTGRRVSTYCERPFIIHKQQPLTRQSADAAVRRNVDSRWKDIGDVLRREAHRRGSSSYGTRSPTADLLLSLADLAMPAEIHQRSQSDDDLQFSTIDVIITHGSGKKFDPSAGYITGPTRLVDSRYAHQQALSPAAPASTDARRIDRERPADDDGGTNARTDNANSQFPVKSRLTSTPEPTTPDTVVLSPESRFKHIFKSPKITDVTFDPEKFFETAKEKISVTSPTNPRSFDAHIRLSPTLSRRASQPQGLGFSNIPPVDTRRLHLPSLDQILDDVNPTQISMFPGSSSMHGISLKRSHDASGGANEGNSRPQRRRSEGNTSSAQLKIALKNAQEPDGGHQSRLSQRLERQDKPHPVLPDLKENEHVVWHTPASSLSARGISAPVKGSRPARAAEHAAETEPFTAKAEPASTMPTNESHPKFSSDAAIITPFCAPDHPPMNSIDLSPTSKFKIPPMSPPKASHTDRAVTLPSPFAKELIEASQRQQTLLPTVRNDPVKTEQDKRLPIKLKIPKTRPALSERESEVSQQLLWPTPSLSKNSTVTYLDAEACGMADGEYQSTVQDAYKKATRNGLVLLVKKERAGDFREEGVVCGFRFVVL